MDKPTQHSRFKLFMIGAVLVLAGGNSFTLWAVQNNAHQRCLETRQRAIAAAPALAQLVEASHKDGATNTEAVWRTYQIAVRQNPIPKC